MFLLGFELRTLWLREIAIWPPDVGAVPKNEMPTHPKEIRNFSPCYIFWVVALNILYFITQWGIAIYREDSWQYTLISKFVVIISPSYRYDRQNSLKVPNANWWRSQFAHNCTLLQAKTVARINWWSLFSNQQNPRLLTDTAVRVGIAHFFEWTVIRADAF